MKQRTICTCDPGNLSYRLHHASLVVREHYRDECWARIGSKKAIERVEHDNPVAVDRDPFGPGNRAEYGIVLDCRDEDANAPSPQERKMVRLGTATDEDDALRRRVEQSRDCRAAVLHRPPRCAAPAVDRGRIAATNQRRRHRFHSLWSQRCRRVPVEVG